MRHTAVFAALLVGLALAACGRGGLVEAPGAQGVIMAGEKLNNKSVTVRTDEVLRVELESLPSAGYAWSVSEAPEFLELAAQDVRPVDPERVSEGGYAGGPHWHTLDFEIKGPGEGRLLLSELKDGAGEAAKTYTLDVKVVEAQ